MICKFCEKEIPDEVVVCPECGKPVDEKYEREKEEKEGNVEPTPAPEPDPAPIPTPTTADKPEQKSKVMAGILALVFGSLGVHNFYLGKNTIGAIQLSITVVSLLLSCCTFGLSSLGVVAVEIWAIIEGIMIFAGKINKDGKGVPLKND